MTTYAQIDGDTALNPQIAEDVAAYKALYPQFEPWDGWDVQEVPDGTRHAARLVNGAWVNPGDPEPLPPPTEPVALTKAQFLALYAANNGDFNATMTAWPTA